MLYVAFGAYVYNSIPAPGRLSVRCRSLWAGPEQAVIHSVSVQSAAEETVLDVV